MDPILRGGLRLIESENSPSQRLGWIALKAFIKQAALNQKFLEVENYSNQIEQQAIERATTNSLRCLTELYKNSTEMRKSSLIQGLTASVKMDQDPKFVSAALAEFSLPISSRIGTTNGQPALGEQRKIVKNLLEVGDRLDSGLLQEWMKSAFKQTQLSSDVSLVLTLLSLSNKAKEALTNNSGQIVSYLMESYSKSKTSASPTERLISEYSGDAVRAILRNGEVTLSMEQILNGGRIYNENYKTPFVQQSASSTGFSYLPFKIELSAEVSSSEEILETVSDRNVVIKPSSFNMGCKFRRFGGWGFGGDWDEETYLRSDERQSVTQLPIGGGADSSWIGFTRSYEFLGFVYGRYNTSGITGIGTDDVTCYGFGMNSRAWQPDACAAPPSRFRFKCGFQVSNDTLFVAVRFKGSNPADIRCTLGSLYLDSVAAEVNTGWKVYCVKPKALLNFEAEFQVSVNSQSTAQRRTIGFENAATYSNYLEILEINDINASKFKYLDVGIKGSPTNALDRFALNYPVANSNGVLTYAANITDLILSKNWPIDPKSTDIITAAVGVLADLKVIAEICKIDFDPILGSETVVAPWKERQKLLTGSLPLICHRVFSKIISQLEADITRTVLVGEKISKIRLKVAPLLESYNRLTVDMVKSAAKSVAPSVYGEIEIVNDRRVLYACIYALVEEIADWDLENQTKRELGCLTWQRFQLQPTDDTLFPSELTMVGSEEIKEICIK